MSWDRAASDNLLLSTAGLRHEQLWRRWFDSARGLVPLHAVQVSQRSISRWRLTSPVLATFEP